MNKYKYNINNLDCANCAREIEEELNKNKDFKDVSVNFNTCKITYTSNKNYTIEELNNIIKKIEPDAYITNNNTQKKEYHLKTLLLADTLFLISYFLIPTNTKIYFYIVSYILLLYNPFKSSIKLLLNKKTINENILMTISCIGALLIGETVEGIMVISLYTIGKILEEKAINKSRKSIKNLINIKEEYANVVKDKKEEKIKVEEVEIGDILIVKKGEKIPVDGIITKGTTKLDTSYLTGEITPLEVKKNDNVLSGAINKESIIEIKATSLYSTSTISKILSLLEEATDKKSKTETTISKISKIYTPIVLILALLVVILLPILTNITLKESIYRGLTFLVISCPCAIAISVPLTYFTAIGVASKHGILIKGSNYLDNLSNIKNIIFDKTGTISNGEFRVSSIDIFESKNTYKYSYNEIIDILRKGETFSNHPIAKSILKLSNKKLDTTDVTNFEEHSGKGISFTLNNQKVLIGNKKLCNCQNNATIHLNIDNEHIASINIEDGIKKETTDVIAYFKRNKIKTFMFTGDKKEIALLIGNKLKIEDIKYEMLPTDKYKSYEEIAKNNVTAFVGDGINDAVVLKRADIGISMGKLGSDIAIEASDIVIMNDNLETIPKAIEISKYTKKIIKENLIFALSFKIIILLLSTIGITNIFFSVFADTGITLLTILNTLKILKKYRISNE